MTEPEQAVDEEKVALGLATQSTTPDIVNDRDNAVDVLDVPIQSTLWDPDRCFVRALKRGFAGQFPTPDYLRAVPVNFIDPTSSMGSVVTGDIPPAQQQRLHVFQKMDHIFRTKQNSTLSQVTCQSYRNGSKQVVEKVRLEWRCTESHGGFALHTPVEHPREWHLMEVCHVYIAACSSMEHYRQKVKPSIQAFISQLEDGGKKAVYLLVFVPTGEKTPVVPSTTEEAPPVPVTSNTRSRVANFASRVAAARQRIAGADVNEDPANNSDPTGGTVASTSTTSASSSTSSVVSEPATLLTRVDRDILRRLTQDFGRVCSLASVVRDDVDDELRKAEWEVFYKELGIVVAEGFLQRCKAYDAAMKQFHNDVTATILTKDSFAFLYQQMGQPAEALLQYEELRALISEVGNELHDEGMIKLALESDFVNFRKLIQAKENAALWNIELEHYLLMREIPQLLAMGDNAAIVRRCKSFVVMVFNMMARKAENKETATSMPNLWALEFCWDVMCAYQALDSESESISRALCDLLSFGRLRLLKLAKAKLPDFQGTKLGDSYLPDDLKSQWIPWTEPPTTISTSSLHAKSIAIHEASIADALASVERFEIVYLKLTLRLARAYEACNRTRHAACLRQEVVEIAIRNNDLQSAAQELSSLFKVYEEDDWGACNFFVLFRLAKIQRQLESGRSYLETLLRTFSSPYAPAKALNVLFEDLSSVLDFLSEQGHQVSAAPIFKPMISLENCEATQLSGADRNLVKKVYSIGDMVMIHITIFSMLPKEIEVTDVSISLFPFRTYVTAIEDSADLEEKDIFTTLHVEAVKLQPGKNDYVYKWIPRSSGQYVIADMVINWKESLFSYTYKELRQPTIRVDILPCEPSQRLEINPNYIIPGHEQTLNVVFSSDADTVLSCILRLVGSPGLMICEQGASSVDPPAWHAAVSFNLPRCDAGGSTSTPVIVKSVLDRDLGAVATLHIEATTTFRRHVEGIQNSQMETSIDETQRCKIERKISSFGVRAFTVTKVEVVGYAADKVLVGVVIKCNSLTGFIVRSWSMNLSRVLGLVQGADLNKSLMDAYISLGESLSFVFDCIILESSQLTGMLDGSLALVFEDKAGRTFDDSYKLCLQPPSSLPLAVAGIESAGVTITPSNVSGEVGRPIDIACIIDLSGVQVKSKEIRYQAIYRLSDWIISGSTEGKVTTESPQHQLKFVAVPLRPGPIKSFMTVNLTVQDEYGRLLELPVRYISPSIFSAVDSIKHTAVAFPVN